MLELSGLALAGVVLLLPPLGPVVALVTLPPEPPPTPGLPVLLLAKSLPPYMKRVAIANACCASAGLNTSRQNDAVADAFNIHLGSGDEFLIDWMMAFTSRPTEDVKASYLVPFGIKKDDISTSEFVGQDIDASRGADHDIGDHGIAHQHILDDMRKIEDARLANREFQSVRGCFAADA